MHGWEKSGFYADASTSFFLQARGGGHPPNHEPEICSQLYSLTPLTLIAALRHPEWGEGGELSGVIKVERENQSYQPINNEEYRVRPLASRR